MILFRPPIFADPSCAFRFENLVGTGYHIDQTDVKVLIFDGDVIKLEDTKPSSPYKNLRIEFDKYTFILKPEAEVLWKDEEKITKKLR